ncbi:hypothetical protein RUM44_006095 [Polyplax serrata]|uniref:Uncharacterized protein n=1 Tax=Polyplax serrata TaxID=468196 RepID=A0ABR1AYY8_POLSC
MGIKKVMVEVLGRPGAGRSNKSKEEEEEVDGHCPVFGLQMGRNDLHDWMCSSRDHLLLPLRTRSSVLVSCEDLL